MESFEYYPVRCYVDEETVVMVMHIPLRTWEDEEPDYNAYRFRKSDIINEIKKIKRQNS